MADTNIALFVAASLAVIIALGPDNIYVLPAALPRAAR